MTKAVTVGDETVGVCFRYPVPDDKFLYINEQEDKKILTLCRRVANVKEWILLREVYFYSG